MKAVILAAGEGKRLRPITSTRPKPLIPIAGKPLLEHTILGLKAAGIDEVLLIVGYKEQLIKDYFGNGIEKFNIKIDYITQEEYLGTAHACGYAKDFVGEETFLMMYGDILVDPIVFKEVVENFHRIKAKGLISLIEVNNPQEYGIITLNSQGYVEQITEKPSPELGLGNLANAGVFIFDSLIFKAIEMTQKSVRDEYEFTDSMELMINQLNGKIIGYIIKDYFWSDIGLPWQLLDANNFILEDIENKILGTAEQGVYISGNVYVGRNTTVRSGTYIQGPCYIGDNNIIGPNAFIRPNTSIEDYCHIGSSEVKNSIILSNSKVPHFNYVGDSIICENVNLGAGTNIANLRFDAGNINVKVKEKIIDSQRNKLGTIIGGNVKTGINVSIMPGKIIGENSIIGAHTLVSEDVAPNTLCYQDLKKGVIKKRLI
ncbi:MAG: glucose-1-phosphate thymidylyltransferase [Promethearchaeota archaeon]|nr:MAG: glucose-1-phosphate thymidylyltransferase [Candidatus Lokiarchaeota archaeon]